MRASAVIKELIAAGVTGDALVTAVERIEGERSAGAIRQARYRKGLKEKEAAEKGVTGDVTASLVTNALYTSLPSSNASLEKKEVVGIARARRRSSKVQLPDDWAPVIEIGALDAAERLREVGRMRNWAKANGILKADWDATWRNWWDGRGKFGGKSGGTQQDQPNKSVSAYCAALGRRLAERKDTADILSLSQGRLQRPGGFRDAARSEPGAVPAGDRGVHHGPGDGHPNAQQVAAAASGGGGSVSRGGGASQESGEVLELAPSRRAIAETPF